MNKNLLAEINAKLMDFTGFDFSAWKTDQDTTKRRYGFFFRKSGWGPRPIDLVTQFNDTQSQSMSLNPEEFVKLHDAMGEFIAEHNLREHV